MNHTHDLDYLKDKDSDLTKKLFFNYKLGVACLTIEIIEYFVCNQWFIVTPLSLY